MNRRAMIVTCLTAVVAAAGCGAAAAADGATPTQELTSVKAAERVMAARWTKQPDSYVLLVALDKSRGKNRQGANATVVVNGEDSPVPPLPPSPPAAPPAPAAGDTLQRVDRGPFFIGNTIANLRGMDPTFGCRTLTLVDRRTVGSGQRPAPPERLPGQMDQPYPPRHKESRIEAWLLKADGSQILPTVYSCDVAAVYPQTSNSVEVSYVFPAADSAQAVAVAIRIDDDFYIEKLQPLEPKPAAQ